MLFFGVEVLVKTNPSIGETVETLGEKTVISSPSKSEDKEGTIPPENKQKRIFWLISIGNATAQSLLFNFFSAFAAKVGVSNSMMGFLTSVRNLFTSLFQGSIGRLSDRLGRRYLLLVGFFLSTAIMTILIFLYNPVMLIVISILQALSLSIIIPVWNATLGDVTETKQRAGYIGKLSAVGTAVSVSLMLAFSLLFYLTEDVIEGWVVLGWTVNIRWQVQYGIVFAVAAFNFLLCLVGAFLLKETYKPKSKQKTAPRMWAALKDKVFTRFFIVNSIYGLMMSLAWPIFPIAQVKVLDMGVTELALASATFTIFNSLAQFFGGKLSDRVGRKPLLVAGRVVMFVIPLIAVAAVLFGDWRFFLLSNVIGGASVGILTVAMNAYILDLAPEEMMGTYSGLAQVGWGIMTFIGSLAAGFILEALEFAYGQTAMVVIMFSVVSGLRLVSSIGFFFIKDSLPKEMRTISKRKLQREAKEKEFTETYQCEDCQHQTK